MKTFSLWSLIFYLSYLFENVSSYLSSEEYRTYVSIRDDFESVQFYNYFKLKLDFFENNPSNYIKTCDKKTVFGSFRNGNITTFFDFNSYGSMGLNFNIAIQKDRLKTNSTDMLNFVLNNEVVHSLRFSDYLNNSLATTLCDKDVYMYNISLVYKNKILRYPPLTFTISTSFDPLSKIDWSLTNLNIVKISCLEKCSVCDSELCLECTNTPNSKFKPNICYCDNEKDFYDYSDPDGVINCQRI